jgi:glucosyl-3-phosphoglycerate phosphatase
VTADRLLLWRHGRTASNAGGRFQGQLDVPLDEVGRVQAKDAAEQLAAEIEAEVGTSRPCRLVSSDLSRAHETAMALGSRLGLPVTTDAALRELSLGSWQGLTHDEVIAVDPEGYAAWRSGSYESRAGGGESRNQVAERTERAIRDYAAEQDGGVLVVASHGAALRGAVLRLIGLTPGSGHVLAPLVNAHWARLDRRGAGWVLSAYNVGPPRAAAAPEG